MYRTIKECYELIKKSDSGSAITQYFIRCLARNNSIKTIQAGNKYLIDYSSLQNYLEKGA